MKIAGLMMVVSAAWAAGPVDVAQVMARVAANQETARDARQSYVYRQEQLLRMYRTNGKLAREERIEYTVTPAGQGSHRNLTHFAGKYGAGNRLVAYDQPGYRYKGADIDGALIGDMAQGMMDDEKSRDGIARDLFPLTSAEQARYDFRLAGEETYRGRAVYRVEFQPKPHLEDGSSWKGDALIDVEECQPVMVQTSLAAKIPLLVTALLGTNIKGLGFSVTYRKFADGVWFPVSYGGEFEVRGLFFYKRKISVSMQNRDFRRADVNSSVVYGTDDH